MEKNGTPEEQGICEDCGDETIVVPVTAGQKKVASKSQRQHGDATIIYLCEGCM